MAANALPGTILALNLKHTRGVLWVLLLALMLRGFVPAGYMPDASALEKGRVELTFCTAAGTVSTVFLSLTDDQAATSHQGEKADSGLNCPYGLLTHVASAPPAADLSASLTVPSVRAIFFEVSRALPPLPAQGPPLGSRAPPSLLG
nr:DUF2946 family protein [Achromobacter ruhlandii]